MLSDVGPNFICRPYRGVSVQDVDIALDPSSVRRYLTGRPVYRRTEFLVLVRGLDRAVVQVQKASTEPLFSEVTDVRCLAGPDEVVFLDDDRVDTGNANQMARAALACGMPARFYLIQGRSQHVNFIVSPRPVRVRLVEVVPPEPAKLLEMAQRVLEFDEQLPPIDLELIPIDLRRIAAEAEADRYLFPCRCAGLGLDVPVEFLDAGPPQVQPWTLVGCERSRQIHEFLYGEDPAARLEICPKVVDPPTDELSLMKCCLIERGIESWGTRVVVPWGASLEEVRDALRALLAVEPTGVVVGAE